jgi:MOSC domain-containing protein YiiM
MVEELNLIAGQGIAESRRYFGRKNREGRPSRRQVSLIEREQIAEHAAALGLERIDPGQVRSNIETLGVNLMALVGQHVAVGEAILHLYGPRTPCAKMDAICTGLRALMENGKQGVMAEVIKSGPVHVGDTIQPLGLPAAEARMSRGL